MFANIFWNVAGFIVAVLLIMIIGPLRFAFNVITRPLFSLNHPVIMCRDTKEFVVGFAQLPI